LSDPFRDLREALSATTSTAQIPHLMHLDLDREERTGIPEIVLAEGKDPATLLVITQTFLEERGRAILSRVRPSMCKGLREQFADYRVEEYPRARMVVVRRPDFLPRHTGGKVGILAAGTSDVPYAEQASVMAEEMGCETTVIYDVGVAGLHRLVAPLRRLVNDEQVDVLIVAAGMDGALPSVVTGLVDLPVIGLPTSAGYGIAGRGVAALLSMLQTCAPGLTVVNIDNGIGAGAAAARIANTLAVARAGLEVAESSASGTA
jgi:pyridinium-3,5-biscarboxylic acid mononucleotide synthase